MGNVGFYSVGKEMRETHIKQPSVAFHESVTSQPSHEQVASCLWHLRHLNFQHVLFTWPFVGCNSHANHKISYSSQFFTKLNTIPITFNTHYYKLNIYWKSQFYKGKSHQIQIRFILGFKHVLTQLLKKIFLQISIGRIC